MYCLPMPDTDSGLYRYDSKEAVRRLLPGGRTCGRTYLSSIVLSTAHRLITFGAVLLVGATYGLQLCFPGRHQYGCTVGQEADLRKERGHGSRVPRQGSQHRPHAGHEVGRPRSLNGARSAADSRLVSLAAWLEHLLRAVTSSTLEETWVLFERLMQAGTELTSSAFG